MNKFAQKLKQLRTDKKLHQKDLANQLTIDQRTVSNWEKGIREPNFDMLIKIAKIFAVSTDYLLGLEDWFYFLFLDKSDGK